MSLNKSFNGQQQSNYYLPPINRNQSTNLSKNRSQSYNQIRPVGQISTTPVARKLINTESLRNIQEYDQMNQKELLREHENLLKILKKYQELIDINLAKKQKERERQALNKSRNGEKKATKEELMNSEASNNKKIIANYLRQIKDLQSAQKHRKLHQVMDEKSEVNDAIAKIKKQIFLLKNQDTMASRNLVTDRGHIQKQLKDAQKDLKTELTRNSDYKKKIQELNQHLKNLKKQCENININQLMTASHQKDYLIALQEKRSEVEQMQRNYSRVEESIQDVIVNKTKRNNGIIKDIQNLDKRATELNNRIATYKQKVSRYQKVIEVQPK